ncbi:YlbF family regulator [Natronospora cellulosivora (SeqCode)]
MSVYDVAHRLSRELKKSDEYKSYLEIKKKVQTNEKSKEMLLDFQKEQFKLQSKAMSGQEITEEDKKKMNDLMNIIQLNNDVQKYLNAEQRISVMLNDIHQIIFSELEIGFNEDEANEIDEG